MKKILALLLSLLLIFSTCNVAIFATTGENVAKVGDTEYATIDEAIANWTNNTTLTLLADVTLSDVINLSSTEYHILDLSTYTMTAASGKDAIHYVVNGRTSASYALDIKADATNPGGITATGASIVRHTKPTSSAPSKDRPITRFYGGVFNATYVVRQGGSWGAGYTGASAPYFYFYGGEFNGTIYTNRSHNEFYGGTFNGRLQMSVDSSAWTKIVGGRFKYLSNEMGSNLDEKIAQGVDHYKFTIGSSKSVYDKAIYVDDEGYYVVANSKPTEEIEASVAMTPSGDDYFYYSEVATEGALDYTDVYMALEKNSSATVTVYVNELDLTDSSFTGTIVVPEGQTLTVTNAPEGVTFEGEGEVIIVEPVAKIGNTQYNTLAEAFAAAQDEDTITLLADIETSDAITNTKNITLDLNGKTITGTDNSTASFGLITNRGTLTVTGNGTITLVATNDRDWNAYSSVISNTVGGKLIVENGTIEHLGGSDMAYGIDNLTNGKGTYAETVVNGGTVKSTYRAIRQFLNGVEAQNILTINGGTVEGANKSIWMQDPSAKANTGTLTVTEDATLIGDVYLYVTEGSTEWPVEVAIAAAALQGESEVLTGNVPAGYAVENTNGTYGVTPVPTGSNSPAYTKEVDGYVRVWGEGGGNAKESFVLKLYSGETLIATTTLNNIGGIIDGDVYVTWNFYYPSSNDEYWTTTWEEGHPNSLAQPTEVELWIDGACVATTPAMMSGADDLNPVVWKELGGVKYVVAGLQGSGTEEDPFLINNKEELLWFQSKVDEQAADGSTQFAGVYFKLTSDIDLSGINWNPIGSMTGDHGSFKGVFDGDGHTISNLYVEQEGTGLGLFARTAGNAVIKNLNIVNATVKSTNNSNYAGVLVGNAYASTKIENVHISGDILVSARGYIGGIAGHGYVVMDNVSVVGNEGSLITSTFWCAGGILGYGGEGATNITNAHVEGLTITSAAGGLGAIVGMAEDNNGTQPISGSNLSAKDVVIKTYVGGYGTAYEDYAMGYLYGGNPTSKLTGTLTIENVTVETASGNTASVNDAVASIDGDIYFDLKAAFNAAQDGDTVAILRDIAVDGFVTVAKETSLTIDLNGHIVAGVDTTEKNFGLIQNNGTLTINDSVGTGKISVTATINSGWNRYSAAISNNPGGTLIVNGGTIEHLGGTDMAYGIDSLTNGGIGDVSITINGGTVTSTYRAIRQFLNSDSKQNVLTINGGVIEGANKALFFHDPSTKANNGTITVGANAEIYGDIYLYVTEGSTEWPVEVAIAAAALQGESEVLTGNVPAGYAVENTNGTYGVVEKTAIATVDGVNYYDLQEAIDATQDGSTVVLLTNIEITNTIKVSADKKLTLDLNGFVIDGTEKVKIALMTYGDLTLKDSSAEQTGAIKAGIGTAGNAVNVTGGTFTMESGSIYSKNNALLIDENASTVNIKGGKITAEPTTNNSAVMYISGTNANVINITGGEMVGFNGILLWNNTEINISGGTIDAQGRLGIQGNGSRDNTKITISGGSVYGAEAAIYHPQGGELNILGDAILTGATGIIIKGGKINISGGTISGTGEASAYVPVSSGFEGTGDALYVEHYDNSTNSDNYGTPVVTITGGTFTSTNGKAVGSYANTNNGVEALSGFISGGTFSSDVSALCADGYVAKDNGDGTFSIEEEEDIFGIIFYIRNLPKPAEDKYQIGVFAGIDSLNYKAVGFRIYNADGVLLGQNTTKTVYSSITAGGTTIKASDYGCYRIFGVPVTFPVSYDDTTIYFEPFAVNFDDTEIVGRRVVIEDINTKY